LKETWNFFKVHLLSDLRNKRSIFWVVIFPILLFTILVLTFSNLGVKGSINFKIILINDSQKANGPNFSRELVNAFRSLSFPNKDAIFTLTMMKKKDTNAAFEKVIYSEADAVLIIPKDFNSAIARSILFSKLGISAPLVPIKVFYVPNRASSNLAESAIEGTIGQINSYLTARFGYTLKAIKVKSKTFGSIMESPSYTNFVAPGIMVIAAFMTGLLLVAPKIAMMRRYAVMKKYASTPVNPYSFFLGFTASRLFIMIIQYIGLALFSTFVLGAVIRAFSWQAFLYYLFSCAVYAAIGFVVGFIASGPTSVGAVSSLINLPLEFLAGIYFPLYNLPWYINIFVYINPLWYSTNALRQFLGVAMSTTPMWMNILVPGIWLIASIAFSSVRQNLEKE